MPQAINCYLSPIYSETNGTSDAAICLTHDAAICLTHDAAICLTHDAESHIYMKWHADDRFVS